MCYPPRSRVSAVAHKMAFAEADDTSEDCLHGHCRHILLMASLHLLHLLHTASPVCDMI